MVKKGITYTVKVMVTTTQNNIRASFKFGIAKSLEGFMLSGIRSFTSLGQHSIHNYRVLDFSGTISLGSVFNEAM